MNRRVGLIASLANFIAAMRCDCDLAGLDFAYGTRWMITVPIPGN
jgi:hypothetical protein